MKRLTSMTAVAAALSAGCPSSSPTVATYEYEADVAVVRVSEPPPTLVGEIVNDEEHREIVMSPGVSMAAQCWDFCQNAEGQWATSNCEGLAFASGDERLLSVHEALLPGKQGTYVLVAGTPGETNLRIETVCGSRDYRVVVE